MAVNIKSPRPLFDRVVVREVIDNSQRFLDLKENNPEAYKKMFGRISYPNNSPVVESSESPHDAGNSKVDTRRGLLDDVDSNLEKAILIAPPNSIIGVVVTPGFEYKRINS
jgi:hypothetical protein